MSTPHIIVAGAREHNLKNIHVTLPRDRLIVVTGLSGSGKSSLAFDTIYAEGQRKYVESLSAYARHFLDQLQQPDVDYIEGLSPAIAIEQRTAASNPRSTIATTTEIYEYLRLLFANIGRPHCPACGRAITSQTTSMIVDQILALGSECHVMLLSPLVHNRKGEFRDVIARIKREGFVRARIDGIVMDVSEPVTLDKKKTHTIDLVVDRLVLSPKTRARLADSVETALKWGDGIVSALHRPASSASPETSNAPWSETVFSTLNACPACQVSFGKLTTRHFSFNAPEGACRTCLGLGTKMYFDPDLIVPDRTKSIANGAIAAWRRGSRRLLIYYKMLLRGLSKHFNVDMDQPFEDLPANIQKTLLEGSGNEEIEFTHWRKNAWRKTSKPFEGVIPNLQRLYEETDSEFTRSRLQQFMNARECPDCRGARLRPESIATTVAGRSILDVTRMNISTAADFFNSLDNTLADQDQKIATEILKAIRLRLGFLKNVGLGYLTLDRPSDTLSGGEAQRIRLATQVGAGLVGVLYVLDEPSIGLHQRDNQKLLDTLFQMRDMGNTVLVVEHDEETIRKADHVVDMGPGAGANGGEVVFSGTPDRLMDSENSLTGQYLSGKKRIEVPKSRRSVKGNQLVIRGACGNNLKHIDVCFPLGRMICITGVSGSGKSTLLLETVYMGLCQRLHHLRVASGKHRGIEGLEHIDKVVHIDQSPIGKTPRSNPATYTGIFNSIRELFSKTPDSRMRGYGPGRFSFNVKGGRCEACKGDGIIKIEMHFLPDVYVACDVCSGNRYNRETLEIRYKGKTIIDILHMTVNQAYRFFQNIGSIREKLQTLLDVGLGYIQLGQPATTLSGGEAQRIKLARELSKRATGRTVYILDEPTTGLHMEDIRRLLQVLNQLVDSGNTVMVIEHNMDVIKCADYIIDLGPEGGDDGGRIVATGTPEEIARIETSYTGRYLKHMLFTACRDAADSARGS